MAVGLTELQAERDRLIEILGKGLRAYEINGRRMEYANTDQVKTALAELERRIAKLKGTGPLREVRISSSKGL